MTPGPGGPSHRIRYTPAMAYEHQLRAAVAAVRAAADVCRKVQINLVTGEAMQKRDKSPVTVADFASQAIVCRMLRDTFPDVPVVGEEDSGELRADTDEALTLRAAIAHHSGLSVDRALDAIDRGGFDPSSGSTSGASGASGGTYWTLDPIDGTKGFLRGEQYAVALALIEGGEVVLGVLGCPNLDRDGVLMAAVRGGGTRRLLLDDSTLDGETVHVSTTTDLSQAKFCESVESGHSDQDASVKIAADLGITEEPYRIDSQCKYAAVARGDAEIYLRLPTKPGYREKIWDHAAGMLVVTEAGGTVTDVAGEPLDFSHGRTLHNNRGIIATGGVDHAQVVAAVRRHVTPEP